MLTLIKNALIITQNPQFQVINKGYILAKNDKIAAVEQGNPPMELMAEHVIDAKQMAVLPGLIDPHTHVAGNLFKAVTEDDDDAFYGLAMPMESKLTPDYTYHMALLGAAECMRGGITCVNDMYHYMGSVAKALWDIGIRGVVSQNIVDVDISALRYDDYTRVQKIGDDYLQQAVDLVEQYNQVDNSRITARFGPHATDTVSKPLAKEIVSLGEKYGVGFHIHVAQTSRETRKVQEFYGHSPVDYLEEVGLLTHKTVAAHCIYLDEPAVDKLAASDVTMLHCAEGLGKDGDMPNIKRFYQKGGNFVLATDWTTNDPFTNMRAGIMLDRHHGLSHSEMNAATALSKCTIEAAKALGMAEQIGSIEVGKQADLTFLNLLSPNLIPMYENPVGTIVYNANRHDVQHVMVQGKFTVWDKKLTFLDEENLLKTGQKIARQIYDCHVYGDK